MFVLSYIGVSVEVFPAASVNTSTRETPSSVTFPLFSTVIVYVIVSSMFVFPSAFTSSTAAVFTTSITGS